MSSIPPHRGPDHRHRCLTALALYGSPRSQSPPRGCDERRTRVRRLTAPLLWVCAASAAALLLHAVQVPAWITITALGLIGWRLAALLGAARLPGGIVRIALGLALVAAVFAQFHTLNGLVPGTAMLMLMASIKLLETRSQRDQYVVIGGALFLLLAACLYAQALVWVPLYGAQALLCCAALAVVAYAPGSDAGRSPAPGLRTREVIVLAGRTLLFAIPLAIPLFLFFPRLPGHFWALTSGDEAISGLGDTLTPGGITRLTASYAIAFRVRFDGRLPPSAERYWRGPVLHEFDGTTWKAGRYALTDAQQLDCLATPYRYRLYLEPTFRHWWLALDTVMGPPSPGVRYTEDYQLIAAEPVTQSLTYDATSCTHVRSLAPLSSTARLDDTRLPAGNNPQTLALAMQLRRRAGSDVAFVQTVLAFLRTGGFTYSLTPPPLGPRPDRRLSIPHPHRLLRPLRLGFRRHDESRRRPRASGHRLSGRSVGTPTTARSPCASQTHTPGRKSGWQTTAGRA